MILKTEGIQYFTTYFGEPIKLYTLFTHNVNFRVEIKN